MDDEKEVPSIDADARLPAQSPHPSAIPILSRQSSRGYDHAEREVQLTTQGFDPAMLFSPRNANAKHKTAHFTAITPTAGDGAATAASAKPEGAKANSQSVSKQSDEACARDCADCTVM